MLGESAGKLCIQLERVKQLSRVTLTCVQRCLDYLPSVAGNSRLQKKLSFPDQFLAAMQLCRQDYAMNDVALMQAMEGWRTTEALARHWLITLDDSSNTAPSNDVARYCSVAQSLVGVIHDMFTSDPPPLQLRTGSALGRIRVYLQKWRSAMLTAGKVGEVREALGQALLDLTRGGALVASDDIIRRFDEALGAFIDLRRFDEALGAFVDLPLRHVCTKWSDLEDAEIRRCVPVLKLNALIVITPTPNRTLTHSFCCTELAMPMMHGCLCRCPAAPGSKRANAGRS